MEHEFLEGAGAGGRGALLVPEGTTGGALLLSAGMVGTTGTGFTAPGWEGVDGVWVQPTNAKRQSATAHNVKIENIFFMNSSMNPSLL